METTSNKPELKGIGGWLAFFIIALIIGPAQSAFGIQSELNKLALADPSYINTEDWFDTVTTAWFVWGIGSFLSFLASIILIIWESPKAVKLVIFLLWLMGPILLSSVILDNWYIGIELEPFHVFEFLLSCASASLWSAYLLMSKRVKNTYGFNNWSNHGKNDPLIKEMS